jgi:hypothetical protein
MTPLGTVTTSGVHGSRPAPVGSTARCAFVQRGCGSPNQLRARRGGRWRSGADELGDAALAEVHDGGGVGDRGSCNGWGRYEH